MPADSNTAFDASTLQSIAAQLACPACLGDLSVVGQALACAACARHYPIVDGIPVLIVDKSTPPPSQNVSSGTSLT